jgi:hypothetical protein
MTIAEQRRQVLQMLADGQITTDDAEQLINALGPDTPPAPADAGYSLAKTKAGPRYLRVLVESPDNFGGEGPSKVNIRVPLKLLRAGVRLAGLMPPWALDHANTALHKKGLDFDLKQIRPQDVEELIEQLHDVSVDVDQPDVKVHLFSE